MTANSDTTFQFARERGVVWVCDIDRSTAFLNSDDTVRQIEEYIPRLHWIAAQLVASMGGSLKWTGDGFMAWFATPLFRELGPLLPDVFHSIWSLTVMNNVTQWGVKPFNAKIGLRHALTLEHDALVMTIGNGSHTAVDVIGRSVVLAFRMASLKAEFPYLITTREVLDAVPDHKRATIKFAKLAISKKDIETYFKGEVWNTGTLYCSSNRRKRKSNLKKVVSATGKVLKKLDAVLPDESCNRASTAFVATLTNGPAWARSCAADYMKFIQEIADLLREANGNIKRLGTLGA